MTKKHVWESLWGPLKVLNNSDDVRTGPFTNERLKDLESCPSIQSLLLGTSKEIIDLGLISHITELENIELYKVKFKNLSALKNLPKLRSLSFERCTGDICELNNFVNLDSLSLTDNEFNIPNNTHLPNLTWLWLVRNKIIDLSFLEALPKIETLHIQGNQINDISPISYCREIVELDLSGNLITDLLPLIECKKLRKLNLNSTGLKDLTPLNKLENIEQISIDKATLDKAILEQGLTEPKSKVSSYIEDINEKEISNRIEEKDWNYYNNLILTDELKNVLSSLFRHGRPDIETIEYLLRHPNENVFNQVVIFGLNSHYSKVALAFEEVVIKDYKDRLVKPLSEGFEYFLNFLSSHNDSEFGRGKLITPHFTIITILQAVSSPDFTPLFILFLKNRNNFSDHYLTAYKRLLDVAQKTKSHELVEHICDLLTYEIQVIGGDNVLLKKCFKVIGALGKKTDIELLKIKFSISNETRADVIKEYEKMISRLERKKS